MALASIGDTFEFKGRWGAHKGGYRAHTDYLALNAYTQNKGGFKECPAWKKFRVRP